MSPGAHSLAEKVPKSEIDEVGCQRLLLSISAFCFAASVVAVRILQQLIAAHFERIKVGSVLRVLHARNVFGGCVAQVSKFDALKTEAGSNFKKWHT